MIFKNQTNSSKDFISFPIHQTLNHRKTKTISISVCFLTNSAKKLQLVLSLPQDLSPRQPRGFRSNSKHTESSELPNLLLAASFPTSTECD
jgi:hypothetical protein